jgi:hypothetical protein
MKRGQVLRNQHATRAEGPHCPDDLRDDLVVTEARHARPAQRHEDRDFRTAVQQSQCRSQRWDQRAEKAVAEAVSLTDIHRGHLHAGHCELVVARDARELVLVADHWNSVGGEMHVERDESHAERDCRA